MAGKRKNKNALVTEAKQPENAAPRKPRGQPDIPARTPHKRFLVPPDRRVVIDLMNLQKKFPMVAHERVCDFSLLKEVRDNSKLRISWPLIMIKAFGIVSREFPVLRQTYMGGPFSTIYQHDCSIASLAIQREHDGVPWLFFARFVAPEEETLMSLQDRLKKFIDKPVKESFGDQMRVASFPAPIRKLIWWSRMSFSGKKRVKRMGTFGLTTLAAKNTTIQKPLSPLPYLLTYGPFDKDDRINITLSYDHRLLDGAQIAQILERLEKVLSTDLAHELNCLPRYRVINLPFEAATSSKRKTA